MSRLCWVFVLVAVVVVLCHARPHRCEQRESLLADLELAEDSLNRAKQLYPNFKAENEISNSSECRKKDKSLGYIDVALDLVSSAKKSIPLCSKEPPANVTTVEPLTNGTTVEPLTNVTTVEPLTNATMVEPLTNDTTVEPLNYVTTVEPMPEITTGIRRMDCQDLLAAGHVTSGVYSVWPQGAKSAVRVRCDMDTDGGGWTVIQRRGNFGKQEDFNRNWQDYKHGFGSLERDFWLGNDHIFALSNQGNYSLRMDMTAAEGNSLWASFQVFRIGAENVNYTLQLSGFISGAAGDSMTYFNTEMFTTKDRKNNRWNTENCAEERKGGFWYWECNTYSDANPNGLYNPGVGHRSSMYYSGFKLLTGLSSFDMKLKRN